MRQIIISQDFTVIISPDDNKEFNIRLLSGKVSEHGICYTAKSSPLKKGDDELCEESKYFIYFDGFQGTFLLGTYSDNTTAKKVMGIISAFILNSCDPSNYKDSEGVDFFSNMQLVMPDESGKSQLKVFEYLLSER